MKIEHDLIGDRYFKYGYIWWPKKVNEEYKKCLPKREFTLDFNGEILKNKKVNWKYRRIYIGVKLMNQFKNGTKIQIIKDKKNPELIKIREKK